MNSNDLNSLLQGQGGSLNLSPQLPPGLSTLLSIASIALTVLSLVIIVLYIASLVRRWRVQSAIFDIQKQVREINQRELTKQTPPEENKGASPIDPIDFAAAKQSQEGTDASTHPLT